MRISRLAFGLIGSLALCAAGMVAPPVSAAAHDAEGPDYLALGDSVAFGYITQAGFEYINADNFVGYAAYIDQLTHLDPANGSCPGETTASFLSAAGIDFGCRGYRAQAPLHAPYGTTQLQFATAFLAAHRDTRLVTVTLGANDLFLLQASCAGDLACITAGLPQVLAEIGANMDTILASIGATGFHRAIVVTNYYSPDYNDAASTQIIQALNQTLASAAAGRGAAVADVFSAFQAAAANPFAAGSPCRAGLLNALPGNQFLCDIHPSQSGHRLIAAAVAGALPRGHADRH